MLGNHHSLQPLGCSQPSLTDPLDPKSSFVYFNSKERKIFRRALGEGKSREEALKMAKTLLQEAIIDFTIENSSADVKPAVDSCVPRGGWLLVICSNAQTATWLKSNAQFIKTKCRLDVNFLEENEFPRTRVIRGYFPQSLQLSNEKILNTITAQNRISTGSWEISHRLPSGQFVHLVLLIDHVSMTRLAAVNGRIAYRFGKHKITSEGHFAYEGAAEC
ncbi:PREDICTED: uncharacterized protein LOC108359036 [Rhagoletis zephyria]|uniref:uncharacterized protein LOC108359036 n=1 Tax=Rhagoletis zephyria TaxID=28612 RepID=UPI00081186A9|nr:PREDICTED: uncharacterized protein LOC108359036 [Rhagoletis zephyria]